MEKLEILLIMIDRVSSDENPAHQHQEDTENMGHFRL
jgi:hypothetical protein